MKRLVIFFVVLAFCLPASLHAQSSLDDFLPFEIPGLSKACEKPLGDFDVTLATYLWTAGLEGTIGVRGVTSYVDMSFGDILKILDVAASGYVEIRKGNFGISSDIMYMKIENTETPSPLLTSKVVVEETLGDAMLMYRMGSYPVACDILAGARYISMSTDIDLTSPLPILNRSASGSKSWVDPVIGSRIMFNLNDNLRFRCRFDVGGFTVSSEQLWHALAAVEYKLTHDIAMVFGYRHLSYRYFDDTGFTFDAGMSGLALAFGIKF
jgi:hypothetical protein